MRSFLNSALQYGLLGHLFIQALAVEQCYYPNGDKSDDVPCYVDGRISHCCSNSQICLDNGYCLEATVPWQIIRGSCTDSSYGSKCNQKCLVTKENSTSVIAYLDNTDDGTPTWCCEGVTSGSDGLSCVQIDGQDSGSFAMTQYGTWMVGVANLSEVANSSESCNVSQCEDVCLAEIDYGNPLSQLARCEKSAKKNETTIGVGIGVPLLVLCLSAVGWALWERKNRLHSKNSSLENVVDASSEKKELWHRGRLQEADDQRVGQVLEADNHVFRSELESSPMFYEKPAEQRDVKAPGPEQEEVKVENSE